MSCGDIRLLPAGPLSTCAYVKFAFSATVVESSRLRVRARKKRIGPACTPFSFIHSLSSPHPRKSTASFPSPRLFRPSLPSPGLFRLSMKVASPDHHKPGPGVEGQISEHTAGGKQRSRSRKAEAGTTHEIPRLLFTRECQFFVGSGDYNRYKVSSWISHVLDRWYRARSGGG